VGNAQSERVKPKPIMMYLGGLKVLVSVRLVDSPTGLPMRALETNVFKYCGRVKEL